MKTDEMKSETFTYEVKCRSCRNKFKVRLFDSHEKNLFVVDKKDWYCETCKKKYFAEQAELRTKAQASNGFPQIVGTEKMVSWAVKIREDLLKKVDYLQKSLTFGDEAEKQASEKGFARLLEEWRKDTDAKWWVDHRSMTVRDISKRIAELQKVPE
jgi:hypothetical protein